MDFFQFASYAEFFVTLSVDANGDIPNRLWICLLVGGLCFLIVYVFQVVGLMTIAKREGYKNRWQIFIPFFNTYYIGVCAQKNKVYNVNARKFAIATAVLELVMVIGYILYYVAAFAVWDYIHWTEYMSSTGEVLYLYANGFDDLPASMHWLGWIFMYFNDFVLSILEIVFIVFKLLLLMAFFRTYSARQYILFSVVAAILPLQGILIYAVRNNKGMNYMDYLKKVRERNYRISSSTAIPITRTLTAAAITVGTITATTTAITGRMVRATRRALPRPTRSMNTALLRATQTPTPTMAETAKTARAEITVKAAVQTAVRPSTNSIKTRFRRRKRRAFARL